MTVKGPKGSLAHTVVEPISVAKERRCPLGHPAGRRARLPRPARPHPHAGQQHGRRRDLGLLQALEIVGVGYRVTAKGKDLEFALGFSHPAPVPAPDGITFVVESPIKFRVEGIDKQLVGEVAANIRKLRKPDPYKGKGVRYAGEIVRRKVGKTGK